ncbi:MAG: hypothetical protein OHK0022_49450 [Roseiflexaceae bacterium]
MTQPWERLAAWLKDYDTTELDNEADVEDRFVMPLFRLLGYPDKHLRRQQTKVDYKRGKTATNQRPDLVYYAYPDKARQSAKTTLVLVEAKEPGKSNLLSATMQGQTYAEVFRPLLICVTNGKHLLVLRRCLHQEDERVVDEPVSSLRDQEQYRRLYDLLNFDTVREQRESLTDELRHAQRVAFERLLRDDPKIQQVLEQGDFTEQEVKQYDRSVTVTKPKISITGNLPMAFGEGSCEIVFSSLLRSGLAIHLNHRDLLGECMLGLGDPPEWDTRRFIEPQPDGSFEVRLGQTTMTLLASEAADLCACIDEFCGRYRDVIIDAEDALKTWDYPAVPIHSGMGFCLLSVPVWMWELTRAFTEEFNRHNGQSPWHIFDGYLPGLCVVDRLTNLDQIRIDRLPGKIKLGPDETIRLVYAWPDSMLNYTAEQTGTPWQASVGNQGIRTASATREWLVNKLFPEVFRHSRERSSRSWSEWESVFAGPVPEDHPISDELHLITPSSEGSVATLAAYIEGIQLWLTSGILPKIAAQPLYGCMAACLKLARRADPNSVNLHYAASNIGGVEQVGQMEYDSFQYGRNPAKAQQVFHRVIEKLTYKIEQLRLVDAVPARKADLITRSLFVILEDGNIQCSQADLTTAQTAIEPLWRRARFDMRHVWPQLQR